MKRLALAVLLILLSVIPVRGQVQGARGFEKTAMDATFALYGRLDDPKTGERIQHFLCTAFAIQKDATGYVIMSAGHCVVDSPAEVTFGVAEDMDAEVQPVTVMSARLEKGEDYFLVHLATSKQYPVLELGDESSESLGDVEINPNFSYGLGKQLGHPQIAQSQITHPMDCPKCVGQILLHAFGGPGGSGSPVISSSTHKVIGILVSILESDGMGTEPISTVKKAMTEPDQFKQLHQVRADPIELIRKMLGGDNREQ